MKKFFSITFILAILVFSACIPAFAEEYSASSYTSAKTFSNTDSQGKSDIIYTERPFEDYPNETIELTDEEKLKIAKDYIAQFDRNAGEPDRYTVHCFKTLSNGMKLVYVKDNTIREYNCLCAIVPLGKYVYHHGDGRSVKLYQNGVFTEFADAYKSGMINDAILDEINEVMYFDRYAEPATQSEPEPDPGKSTKPIQAATQAAAQASTQAVVTTAAEADTTVQATTVPGTTEAKLDRATPDSTPDLASAGSNSGAGGTVATGGDPALAIIIALAVAAAAGIGIAAARKSI